MPIRLMNPPSRKTLTLEPSISTSFPGPNIVQERALLEPKIKCVAGSGHHSPPMTTISLRLSTDGSLRPLGRPLREVISLKRMVDRKTGDHLFVAVESCR